ncbi:HEPN domain-containing protein [Hymenobacter sp.]|uniref:HEPN domain-containing protein n=1 Tax=Hymenobacter sp. TaxID=1898978 RepID=UPI00286D428D|nr:HEPN domain-containing protein [Hymenobacter sp.]
MQPKTPEQKRAEILLRVADRDMEVAELLLRHSPHLYENVGFSCQQAVEKYAKAVLIANNLLAPHIHVLVKLLLPLVQSSLIVLDSTDTAAAATLQDFAVEWRYETDDAPGYTSADLLDMARRFQSKLRPLAVQFLT